ncbi:MAG TPA: hypothetical protein VIL71_18585 [Spirillospora sp.]
MAKHINAMFTKLDIAPDARDNRRVLAALLFLRHGQPPSDTPGHA